MLKKSEVIEALNNGGHITIFEIGRAARVYDAEGCGLGTCRFDTAERIGNSEGYKRESKDAWTYSSTVTKEPTQNTQPATAANNETEEQNMNTFAHITEDTQKAYEAACVAANQETPAELPNICGTYGRGCRCMNDPDGANRALCMGCPLAAFALEAESERVHAATLAALAPVIAEQEPEPDYLDERWPTSNAAPVVQVAPGMYKPGVYYTVEHRTPGSACVVYSHAETVDDLETLVQQIKNGGGRIDRAWRQDRSTGERREFIPETRQERTDRENREQCKRISDELDAYAQGRAYRCPECGEVIEIDDLDELETENEDGCTVYRLPCGCETEYEPEQLTLYDYFEDALDIEYRCDGRREYRSVSVMVACGGPNIYVDTDENAVLLYWWGDRARYSLDSDTAAAVDEWAEEYWNCL